MRVCPRCKATYVAARATCALDSERLIETDRDPLIGDAIDRYQVVEHLGSGGMGRVYRAKHTTLDREYAIKVLYGDLASEDMFRARFQREASTISRILHPNVVSVSDFGITESGLPFIVMELLRGRTLLRIIDQEGPLVPPRAGRVARQIAEALDAAHSAGFVHRDVKSTNVMLIGAGADESVKVLDFGTVSLGQQKIDDRLTTIGQIIGTPAYMAPEQFEDPAVGPAADIYSLGVVLYHMLAGRLPFSGSRPTELMVQHMTQRPTPLPECGGLEQLALRLLEKEPELRPPSAAHVIRAIDSLILDGGTDGFTTETEQVPVAAGPPAMRLGGKAEVQVFDRPPIAEADTPRDDEVPTLVPDDTESVQPSVRDTEADDLFAPDLPGDGPPPPMETARTKLLSDESFHPRTSKPGRNWPMIMFATGMSALFVVVVWSLLR